MAKQKKSPRTAPERSKVRHHEKSPCAQAFNINAKPGKKSRSWWNGYRQSASRPDAE